MENRKSENVMKKKNQDGKKSNCGFGYRKKYPIKKSSSYLYISQSNNIATPTKKAPEDNTVFPAAPVCSETDGAATVWVGDEDAAPDSIDLV